MYYLLIIIEKDKIRDAKYSRQQHDFDFCLKAIILITCLIRNSNKNYIRSDLRISIYTILNYFQAQIFLM